MHGLTGGDWKRSADHGQSESYREETIGWVTADEVYGIDPDLRAQLETLRLGYVLGIGCNRRVTVHGARGGVRMRADQVAAGLAGHCWTRYSAGAVAKGPHFYDWAFVALHPDDGPGHRWLLVARHAVSTR